MSLKSVQKAKISSLFWQGFFGSKKGVWGNPPTLSECPAVVEAGSRFSRAFLRSSVLPNGQGLWKNRARRQCAIGTGDQIETSRCKNPGHWSIPDLEKVQHRASYGLGFPLIGAKNFVLPTGGEACGL